MVSSKIPNSKSLNFLAIWKVFTYLFWNISFWLAKKVHAKSEFGIENSWNLCGEHLIFFFDKGEDPEAMLIATKIAMEYRQKYAKDVFIEQHCFRRWGHNELDDPTMTNPLLYKQITNRQSVPDAYVETLKDNVDIDNEVVKNHSAMLNDHFKQIETYQVTFLYIL